jgi:hypothetical protein
MGISHHSKISNIKYDTKKKEIKNKPENCKERKTGFVYWVL